MRALQPDRPSVCGFWLLALLSCFTRGSGTNEEGLQVACMHLSRYIFAYTGHAVPQPLRRRLARFAEAARIRLEVTRVSLAAPLARRCGPVEDRVSAECTEAAVRLLRYVMQRDAAMVEDAGDDVRAGARIEGAVLRRVRTQLARALLMGRQHSVQKHSSVAIPELRVPDVAKLVVAVGVRGAGLVSTAFGWLLASGECQRLLECWMDPAWWRVDHSDDLLVALNAGFHSAAGRARHSARAAAKRAAALRARAQLRPRAHAQLRRRRRRQRGDGGVDGAPVATGGWRTRGLARASHDAAPAGAA